MAGPSLAWVPDILGKPFEQLTMPLGVQGAQGELVATLVRSIPNPLLTLFAPLRDVDVLYVHGWSDYFFQREVAQFWTSRGARFYALDLRRYGRSLRPGMTPGYIDRLEDYDIDLAAALDAMGQGSPQEPSVRRLVLMGHSTGGLILTLWASRHAGRAAALVLNSPWLELQLGAIGRHALAPLVEMRARWDPRGAQPEVDFGFYTRAQQEIGSLPDDPERATWRPDRGFPTAPGWLAAVMDGHRAVAAGIEVGCPAFVMLSAHSTPPLSWKDTMTTTDSVLWVDDIARAATRIGRNVTLARIEGAIHDVFLSRPEPRAEAFAMLRRWSDGYIVHH
ncbi:alpha/beta hydrolase [Microbacterium kyungheense]|jgi:alpha-beta hydrolase superfamily lysophospholipase|uniref:Alpha-beta hydrolase superfamily lysophospholipase n=1 Tax=Microbacterium kyungheense TaxID=1263636 RepID=A0A543EE11_9MICO|nr:alpha/beta hydrolase [Microbacterium kyungheense]TQM19838.1 alpha-beta hydrolase superfamily lysophospholipase [Microbacterium kyungheense]